MVYNEPRSASCKCVSNCHMFLLSKEHFKLCFYNSIKKAEANRQLFLTRIVKPFQKIHSTVVDSLYKKMLPVNLSKGEVLYEQGSKAEFIYFLFMGQCSLVYSYLLNSLKQGENSRNNESGEWEHVWT